MRITFVVLALFASASSTVAAPIALPIAYTDPVTGYEWAGVPATTWLLYAEVDAACPETARLACTGDLEGWHFAGPSRVLHLLDHLATDLTFADLSAGDPWVGGTGLVDRTALSTWAPVFMATFGSTMSVAWPFCGGATVEHLEAWANGSKPWGAGISAGRVSIHDASSAACDPIQMTTTDFVSTGWGSPGHGELAGFWLYRKTVPEPTTLALIAFGLAAVARRSFRR